MTRIKVEMLPRFLNLLGKSLLEYHHYLDFFWSKTIYCIMNMILFLLFSPPVLILFVISSMISRDITANQEKLIVQNQFLITTKES